VFVAEFVTLAWGRNVSDILGFCDAWDVIGGAAGGGGGSGWGASEVPTAHAGQGARCMEAGGRRERY
jgi:hypothetical protein